MVKLNFSANPPLAIKGEIFCLFVLFITNTSFVRGQWKDTIALKETVVSLSLIDRFLAKSASKIPRRVPPVKFKSEYAIQAINVEQDTFQFKSIVNTYYLKKHIDWRKSIHQQYHWEYISSMGISYDSLSGSDCSDFDSVSSFLVVLHHHHHYY